jgi:UDP-N-acetylmuramate--alanine ligase
MTHTAAPSHRPWATRLQQRDPSLRIHLIGLGGTGLSPIAQVLLEMGFQVSGSDRKPNAMTARLAERGATVMPEQRTANLLDLSPEQRPDVVLISSAVDMGNPERQAAASLGLPTVKRSDFLPALLAGRRVIGVAGTHGKSTTTAMIVHLLRHAGLSPGYIVGADLPNHGNAAAGQDAFFVIEADEYDHMFLGLNPTVAVITNVEWDHPDFYPTAASFRRAFMQYVDSIDRRGLVISCRDDAGAEQLRAYGFSRGPEWITYGLDPAAELQAVHLEAVAGQGYQADILHWGMPGGRLNLQVPGLHNVRNALAAVAAAGFCDVPPAVALDALQSYQGIARRFEHKGEVAGVLVIDDYAHHPTEIQATLAAARQRFPDRRLWAIFQPHTYSRTRTLLTEIAASFGAADQVIITDIFAAREQDDGSIHAADIVAAADHPAMRHISGMVESSEQLASEVQPGDVVITLGAGDGYRIGELLLAQLESRRPNLPPGEA